MVTEIIINQVVMSADLNKVEVYWTRRCIIEGVNGADNKVNDTPFWVGGNYRPHKTFVDKMKELRKFCLELVEIEVDTKALPNWTVGTLKIQGDLVMKQSRAVMILAKKIKFTGKVTYMNVPQVTMYPSMDDKDRYHNAEKMTEVIEAVVRESEAYINGKYETEDEDQLALFPKEAVLN